MKGQNQVQGTLGTSKKVELTKEVQGKAKEVVNTLKKEKDIKDTIVKAGVETSRVNTSQKNKASNPKSVEVKDIKKEVPAKETPKEAPKAVDAEEVTDEEIFAVVGASKIEEAVRAQLANVQIDVDIPVGAVKLTRLRDNARQAYKENEVRFKRTLEDLEDVRERMEKNPKDESLKKFQVELDVAVAKYVGKMRKYLKRYDVAKGLIIALREEEEKAKEAGKPAEEK